MNAHGPALLAAIPLQGRKPKMADKTDKVESNIPGKYYVDSGCIDCDVCRETAPENFMANEDEGYSYVFNQPQNDEQEAQCRDALESCPVEAIGDDGEEP